MYSGGGLESKFKGYLNAYFYVTLLSLPLGHCCIRASSNWEHFEDTPVPMAVECSRVPRHRRHSGDCQ